MPLKEVLKSNLPKFVLQPLRYAWNWKQHLLPLQLSGPIVQIYINSDEIESFIGINNFYSFLSAQTQSNCRLRIELYGPEGQKLLVKNLSLKNFASKCLPVSQLLAEAGLSSKFGLVLLQLTPMFPLKSVYADFGLAASHFYIFYKSKTGSIGHIHPSSSFDEMNSTCGKFISNQEIYGKGLSGVVLYQANPSIHRLSDVEHFVIANKKKIWTRSFSLSPLAVHRTVIPATELQGQDQVFTIGVDPLPTSNSKPVLFRYYGQNFSVSHS